MKIKGIKLLKGDIIIIALIAFLAIGILILTLPKTYDNNVLEIYVNGELVESVELSENTYQIIEIDEFVQNTIEIDGTSVRVIDSTCYDHICENTGSISKSGEVIVCMPNKLLLKIVGEDASELDGVVG